MDGEGLAFERSDCLLRELRELVSRGSGRNLRDTPGSVVFMSVLPERAELFGYSQSKFVEDWMKNAAQIPSVTSLMIMRGTFDEVKMGYKNKIACGEDYDDVVVLNMQHCSNGRSMDQRKYNSCFNLRMSEEWSVEVVTFLKDV